MRRPGAERGRGSALRLCLFGTAAVLVAGALLWEWSILESHGTKRRADADADVRAPTGPATKTSWGYDLTQPAAGSADYWRQTTIICKKTKEFTMSEVAHHNTKDSLYLVIRGFVVDVTSFRADHPGGDIILEGGGVEAGALFEENHQPFTANLINNFCIGRAVGGDVPQPVKDRGEGQAGQVGQEALREQDEQRGGGQRGEQDADEASDPDAVVDGKTPWGFIVRGDNAFWAAAGLKCAKKGKFSMADIKKNDGSGPDKTFFLLIRGYVFDVTKFRDNHPGGEAILQGAGIDATETFEANHQPMTGSLLNNWCIGRLYPDADADSAQKVTEDAAKADEKAGGGSGPKTSWGYELKVGSEDYWQGVQQECTKNGKFSMVDIKKNDGSGPDKTYYLLIRGYVYDVTKFRTAHPGGEAILQGAGIDAAAVFEENHQPTTAALLKNFCIGRLEA